MLIACCAYGKVIRLMSMDDAALQGCVTVTFESLESATCCAEALHGRWFDGRQLETTVVTRSSVSNASTSSALSSETVNTGYQEEGKRAANESDSIVLSSATTDKDISISHASSSAVMSALLPYGDEADGTVDVTEAGTGAADDVDDFLNSLL